MNPQEEQKSISCKCNLLLLTAAPQAAVVIIAPCHAFDQLLLSVVAHDISHQPEDSQCEAFTTLAVIHLYITSSQ